MLNGGNARGRELISCNVQDNFRIGYATLPGNKALILEDHKKGGYFTKAFYNVMMYLYNQQMLNETDFQTVLRMTSQKSKAWTEEQVCPIVEDYTNYKIFIKCKYAADLTKLGYWETLSLKRYIKMKTKQEQKVRDDEKKKLLAADSKEQEAENDYQQQYESLHSMESFKDVKDKKDDSTCCTCCCCVIL